MTESVVKPGHLYVVATPIGNLGDLSPRALKVLDAVDLIAAEDTRVTGALLAHFGVRKKLVALHDHNEAEATDEVLAQLKKERSVALVSDAGTPLLSDPGFGLVREARGAGIPVVAVPGPCAAIAALSIAGLPSDSFVFAGFLPAKEEGRKQRLLELAAETRTVILYESTHRIVDSAQALADALGDRRVCLAREITKLFEESVSLLARELPRWLKGDENRERGEFVLLIEGAEGHDVAPREAERTLKVLLTELGASKAAKLAAELTGLPRKELYAIAVRLGGHEGQKHEDEAN
ncbi:MAG TPA: 16S rRNA (cytidine(1402)-2'-O)-methyltransferase [Verrucomicrobiae bacterium]|nr:16S rRNA (cytidine(1402)-2'-O)-methyltransferase [Verrucomicrobiae bacterium]